MNFVDSVSDTLKKHLTSLAVGTVVTAGIGLTGFVWGDTYLGLLDTATWVPQGMAQSVRRLLTMYIWMSVPWICFLVMVLKCWQLKRVHAREIAELKAQLDERVNPYGIQGPAPEGVSSRRRMFP